VKIWEKRNAYDPEKSKLFTWMYAISRNIAIDQKRKMKAKPTEDIQKASLIVSLNNDLDKKSNSFDLSDNLKNLEQKYQHIINALYFEGYTQQELADDTGIPLGTIKSRLKIGLRELRNVYLKGVLLMIILCAV
jgi:RNA polymerase sigma-70 factor (ECF subfamily)